MRLAALLLLYGSMAAAQTSPFVLPAPTGPFAVGTTSWHLASSRRDSFDAAYPWRWVKVTAWYPVSKSARGGTLAPYLRETIAEARTFATVVRAPGVFDSLGRVATHSVLDAPLLPPAERPTYSPKLPSCSSRTVTPGSRARTPRCSRIWPVTATS